VGVGVGVGVRARAHTHTHSHNQHIGLRIFPFFGTFLFAVQRTRSFL